MWKGTPEIPGTCWVGSWVGWGCVGGIELVSLPRTTRSSPGRGCGGGCGSPDKVRDSKGQPPFCLELRGDCDLKLQGFPTGHLSSWVREISSSYLVSLLLLQINKLQKILRLQHFEEDPLLDLLT